MLEETATGVGRRFGRYELLCRFAAGGMASLYLARLVGAEGFERLLAVKVIHEHLTLQKQFVNMFIDEARIASRISHPNVAMTLDLGRVGSKHFIAMEYVEGESLAGLLRRTAPPITHAVRIICNAAAGLHAAHELRDGQGELLGVVHRDVSPQNILISYEGAVKVVDFGVARARGRLHTTTGEIKGKFAYMAPEQFSAPETVDRRADIFALGVVLYEATTRRRLFKAETEADTVSRVLGGQVTPPTQVVQGYPPDLERIVFKALRPDPAKRHQTAQELQDELERVIFSAGEPVSTGDIARTMQEVFADHIEEKKLLRTMSTTNPEIPMVDMVSDTSLRLEPLAAPLRVGRARVVTIVVVVLLLALAGAGAVVLYSMRERGARAPAVRVARPDAAPRDTVRLITIAASASPADAKLELDGKTMENPFEIRRPAAEGSIELVASAPGHKPQRFTVPLSRGGTWTVGLLPEAPKEKEEKKHKKRHTKRRGPGFLDNPYE